MSERQPRHKQALQLRLLNELSTKLQSLIRSENFFQEVVDLIQSHFSYYSVHIWSSEPATVLLRAQSGAYNEHLLIGHKLDLGTGITGRVIASRKSYLCNDVEKDPNFIDLNLPVHSRSELSVPIILKDDSIFGTLNIESEEPNFFDEDDVVTMESIASQISVALENQKIYFDAKAFNRKLQNAVDEKTIELKRANDRILEQQKLLKKENKTLRNLVNKSNEAQPDLIGNSSSINNLLSMVDKIAPTSATVLIQGESGTGKELIARRLHFRGDRSDQPYVAVNCGALQESLLESELFGHEKGAFTGAVTQKIGLCEMANGGTLFLDEIGEMSLSIQAKLLRFLQEGEFYRIGGKRPLSVDVRVLSATNRELEKEVKESRFREDLYYRLNTITLRIPPLRKRKEDIPLLIDYFIENSRFGGSNPIRKVDPRVTDVFCQYDWPGNIRELQNTIERLKILAENNEIKLDDIPFNIRMPKSRADRGAGFSFDMPLEEVEKNHILRTLAYNHGNKTRTARSLGITIKTLYNKLHRYGILNPNQNNTTV